MLLDRDGLPHRVELRAVAKLLHRIRLRWFKIKVRLQGILNLGLDARGGFTHFTGFYYKTRAALSST